VKYILFQRTGYLALANSLPLRALRKLVPSLSFNRMVELEARVRRRRVKAMYLAGMEKEYLSIKRFLPGRCSRVLDVGCGIAGVDIFLNRHYSADGVEFFLLDRSVVEDSVYYSYTERGAFYSSLELAKEILVQNGVQDDNVHLIEATEDNEIDIQERVDLVVSLLSWGFHYPVSVYLEQVHDLLDEGGVVILDVNRRRGSEGLDLLAQRFGDLREVEQTRTYLRVCAKKRSSPSPA
jgi:SAM-dependent methyltransferase